MSSKRVIILDSIPFLKQLSEDEKKDFYSCVAIFFLSLFFCWLLSLAYPQGLVTEETSTYWTLGQDFHWFSSNQLDFFRTVPYSLLLRAATKFANPTNALYWLNAFWFSLDAAMAFIVARLLFASRRAAIAIAVLGLIFEVLSMHIFYMNLQLCPDPIYAETAYFAILITLIGWLKNKPILLLLSSSVLGVDAFLKPAGAVICFLWLPFITSVLLRCPTKATKRYALIAGCFILCLGPISFWCLRNFFIYGHAGCIARTGGSFLESVLPIRTNDERFFDNQKDNVDFRFALDQCERGCAKCIHPDEIENASLGRYYRYDRYYLYGPAKVNPFSFIARMKFPNWGDDIGFRQICDLDPKQMFELDPEAGRVAWVIIKDHPFDYLSLVFREYCQMYQPLLMWTNPHYSYQSNPRDAYYYWDVPRQGRRQIYPALYPESGLPSARESNLFVACVLGAMHENFVVQAILNCYYALELLVSHLIFIAACVVGFLTFLIPGKFAHPEQTRRISIVVGMLFLTVAANAFFVALCNVAKLRYQITGEMELHLAFLVTLFACARPCMEFFRSMSTRRVSGLVRGESSS